MNCKYSSPQNKEENSSWSLVLHINWSLELMAWMIHSECISHWLPSKQTKIKPSQIFKWKTDSKFLQYLNWFYFRYSLLNFKSNIKWLFLFFFFLRNMMNLTYSRTDAYIEVGGFSIKNAISLILYSCTK